MNIYLDAFFKSLFENQFNYNLLTTDNFDYETEWLESLPDDIDIIALSFYTNDFDKHKIIANRLLTKSKNVIINFSEPTSLSLLSNFKDKVSNLYCFSDIVTNIKTPGIETAISWFIRPNNFYANNSAALNLIQSLKPYTDQRMYKFDCLLGSEKENRSFVAEQYQNSSFKNQFFFTYYKLNRNQEFYPQWSDHLPFGESFILSDQLLPVDIYNNSFYSIVAETTFSNVYNQYTEKVIKPVIAKRPFVAFCGRHYLKNLKKLGFKTFDKVIDESYDEVNDNELRWKLAWKQVELLCEKNPLRVYNNLRYILDHNYNHFFDTDWHLGIKETMLNLVQSLKLQQ